MDRLKRIRSTCTHAGRSVVHPVGGGHRAHCLKCGLVGPLREGREEARRAILPSGAKELRGGERVSGW